MVVETAGVRRVLVTRLRYLGDVVLSTPLLGALREIVPDARIEYLTLAPHAEVLRHHPWVDEVHALSEGAGMVEMARMAARLRHPRIDWWIDLFSGPRSALLCALARPRLSVGGNRGLRSRVYRFRRGSPGDGASAIEIHLDKLFPLVGRIEPRGVRLALSEAERREAWERFEPGRPGPILLHPAATWPSKEWPEEKWAELARSIQRRGLAEVWIVSVQGREELGHRIARLSGTSCRVLPPLELRELLGLLSWSAAYVGNDGGILHCAVGVGTPTVGIFGPTEREIWFPHEAFAPARVVQEAVPCRPCHRHTCDHLSCLRALPVSRVMQALQELLREGRKHDIAD